MRRSIILLAALLALPVFSQQYFTSEGDIFLLPEFMAMIGEEGDIVKVNMVGPASSRPEAYRNIDLQKDDQILFINKKRIRSVDVFQEKYEAMAIGDTVMLGMRRGEGEMFILRFPKIDSAKSGMRVMRTVSVGDGAAPTILSAEGLILIEEEGRVKVAGTLPSSENVLGKKLEKDDTLSSINDKEILNMKMFNNIYDKIKVGEAVTMIFERGDEIITTEFKKPAPGKGMMTIKK
ncbi:hypothetical protein KAR48_12215 [bacterium]|nr:hypothetical protein [bacterium]